MRRATDDGAKAYAGLEEHASQRVRELTPLLAEYVAVTDGYGEIICGAVTELGRVRPTSAADAIRRDMVADVFDFLYEARFLAVKGKLEVAYPLARRAYESLSLAVAMDLDASVRDRWTKGRPIKNHDIRRVLATHPRGEAEEELRALYAYFCETTHPSRAHVADRLLGCPNAFTLGSVGVPSLAWLADYGVRSIALWRWFSRFVCASYRELFVERCPDLLRKHVALEGDAHTLTSWLVVQLNAVLADERASMDRTRETHVGPASVD